MSPRLTASRISLASICSHWLSGQVECSEDPAGPAAQIGNAVHDAVAFGTRAPTGWERAVAFARELCSDTDQHEVAYALDVDSGLVRILGYGIGRKYEEHGATERDICGTTDVTGKGIIREWKTGKRADYHAQQVRLLAAMSASAGGETECNTQLVYLRRKRQGDPILGALDSFDIASALGEARQIVQAAGMAQPVPGHHCWRCPARRSCPVSTAAGNGGHDVWWDEQGVSAGEPGG